MNKIIWKRSVMTAILISALEEGRITGGDETRGFVYSEFRSLYGPKKVTIFRSKFTGSVRGRFIVRREDGKYVLANLRRPTKKLLPV
jgi:hypothetical protein